MPTSTAPVMQEVQQAQRTGLLQGVQQWMVWLLDDGKHKKSIAALDGVRAIACLCVLIFHLNYYARETHVWYPVRDFGPIVGSIALAGQSGVTLFFVLSGFLLFMPYAKSLLFHTTWPSARLFYIRRAFRIIPAYYVVLFTLILLAHREYLQPKHLQELGLFLTFFMDAPSTYQKINGPFWTLAVEAQFYMLLPLIALGIGLIARRRSIVWRIISLTLCLIALILWGIFSRYWGHELLWHPTHTFLGLPRPLINVLLPFVYGSSGKYLEDFAVGMLISCAYIYLQNTAKESKWNTLVRSISPLLFMIALAELFFMALWHFNIWYHRYTLSFLDPLISYYEQWNEICLAIGFGLFMSAILFGTSLFQRSFVWLPLRCIGLISYSLYMIHVPLLAYFSNTVIKRMHDSRHLIEYALFCSWVVLIIIPLSLLAYVAIEKPFIRIGEQAHRLLEKKKPVEVQT